MNLFKIVKLSIPITILVIIGLIPYVPAFFGHNPLIPYSDAVNFFLTVAITVFAAVEGYSTYMQVELSQNRNLIEDTRNELEKAYGPLYTLVNKQPLTNNKLLTLSEEKKKLDQIMTTYPFMFSDDIYNMWREKIQNIEQGNMNDPPHKTRCIATLGEFTDKLNEEYESKVKRYNKLLKK